MATPTADVESCSSKAVTALLLVSSHAGVDPLSSDLSLSKFFISSWVNSEKEVTLVWLKWLHHQVLASPSRCSAAIYVASLSSTGWSRNNASSFLAQFLAVVDPSNLDSRNLFPLISTLLQDLLSSLSWTNWGKSRVSLEALGWHLYSAKYTLKISCSKWSPFYLLPLR